MSGNCSSGGDAGGFERGKYEQALTDFRELLDNAEVVGFPKRGMELQELTRLVAKYPDETEDLLAKLRAGEEGAVTRHDPARSAPGAGVEPAPGRSGSTIPESAPRPANKTPGGTPPSGSAPGS
jgi:hypothetical protein